MSADFVTVYEPQRGLYHLHYRPNGVTPESENGLDLRWSSVESDNSAAGFIISPCLRELQLTGEDDWEAWHNKSEQRSEDADRERPDSPATASQPLELDSSCLVVWIADVGETLLCAAVLCWGERDFLASHGPACYYLDDFVCSFTYWICLEDWVYCFLLSGSSLCLTVFSLVLLCKKVMYTSLSPRLLILQNAAASLLKNHYITLLLAFLYNVSVWDWNDLKSLKFKCH